MRKILVLFLGLFLFGCGYSAPPYVPYVENTVLDQNTCEFGHFDIGNRGETGVIDSSFDSDLTQSGIQTAISFTYDFGVPPEGVQIAILQNGKMLYTTNPFEGTYEAWLDLRKESSVMVQVYSYGWCRKPIIIYSVKY